MALSPLPEVCGKRRYDLSVAQLACRQLQAKQDGSKPGRLTVYWCRECEAWHVGHTREGHDRATPPDA
jgi:hypothetical protein